MRKSWKWALCLGVVSLLLLGGCGKEKTEPVDLVLVTDGSEVASDAVYHMKQVFRQDGQQRTMKTPSKRRRRREHPLSSVPERA